MNPILANLTERLTIPTQANAQITGRVLKYDGLIVETSGFPATPGALCEITTETGDLVQGEVIGFADGRNLVFLDQPNAPIVVPRSGCAMAGGMPWLAPRFWAA